MRCFGREEREFQKEPRGLKPRLGCCPELPGHGAGSCLQSPLGRHTVPCGACFHPPVQQKSEGEMNTLSDVFAELRPEEIEKPPSQYGTGFTECAGPHVKGTLPGRSQKGWPLGGTSRVRNGGRHAQPPDTAERVPSRECQPRPLVYSCLSPVTFVPLLAFPLREEMAPSSASILSDSVNFITSKVLSSLSFVHMLKEKKINEIRKAPKRCPTQHPCPHPESALTPSCCSCVFSVRPPPTLRV